MFHRAPTFFYFLLFASGIIFYKSPLTLIFFAFLPFLLIKRYSIFAILIFIALGSLYMRVRAIPHRNHIGFFNNRRIKIYAECVNGKIFKTKELIKGGEIFPITGKFYLITKRRGKSGDLFLIEGKVDSIDIFESWFASYLRNHDVFYVIFPEKIIFVKEGMSIFKKIKNRFRKKLEDISQNERRFAFYRAIMLGEREGMKKEIMENFRRTGTIHILAISGLHVGLIFLIFYVTLRFLRLSKKKSSFLSGLFLFLYLFTVGFIPSLLRAVLFITSFLFSLALQRRRNYNNSLGFAGLLSLIIFPKWIFDIGFQLSYLATFGIISLIPLFNRLKNSGLISRYLGIPILISLTAQIFTMPLVASRFGIISLISPIANLVLTPILTLILSQLEISLLLMVYPPLSLPFQTLSNTAVDILHLLVKLFSSIPYSYIEIQLPDSLPYLVYPLLFGCLFLLKFLKS